VAARYYLSANGLKLREKGGNVTILPTKNADILTLFLKKEIDAAWVPEPWGARLVREAGGQVLVDERTLWPEGKFVTAHIIVSTRFLKSNPDLVKQWLDAHVDVTRWILANPAEAKNIANKELERLTGKGLAAEVLDDAWQRMEVTYDPISASLLKSADNAFAMGFLGKNKPDLGEIYDLKLLNEVLLAKDLPSVR
jgi:NitT/TauT family transport system substrate-binding protein